MCESCTNTRVNICTLVYDRICIEAQTLGHAHINNQLNTSVNKHLKQILCHLNLHMNIQHMRIIIIIVHTHGKATYTSTLRVTCL